MSIDLYGISIEHISYVSKIMSSIGHILLLVVFIMLLRIPPMPGKHLVTIGIISSIVLFITRWVIFHINGNPSFSWSGDEKPMLVYILQTTHVISNIIYAVAAYGGFQMVMYLVHQYQKNTKN